MTHPEKSKEIVGLKNLTLSFDRDRPLFSNLNLSLKKGQFYFLTGVSGAGKSTLLKTIYLAALPDKGSICLFDRDVSDFSFSDITQARRQIGIVFQDFRLVPHLNILDNVALPLKIRGISTKKARKHASELLAWVGLQSFLGALPHTLSGGQQQRVAIARAVISKPKLLLADEPTGNVDDAAALKILYLFEEMHKSGTTIVLATHNRLLAQDFKHPEIFLQKGQALLFEPSHREKNHAL